MLQALTSQILSFIEQVHILIQESFALFLKFPLSLSFLSEDFKALSLPLLICIDNHVRNSLFIIEFLLSLIAVIRFALNIA